ncbi:MAG: hypothetical protein CMD35_06080 [Flavobacteriales bacterium]|nr:hypothetical protein [Flavobacteriales bacterium]
MIKNQFILYFTFLITGISQAEIIETHRSGKWTDSETWINGVKPGPSDSVLINIGDTVFINSSNTQCFYLKNMGILFFKSQTNFLKCKNAFFDDSEITGSYSGTFETENLYIEGGTIFGQFNLKVSNKLLIKDSLSLKSRIGSKKINDFINLGTLLNPANENIILFGNLQNTGTILLNEGTLTFMNPSVINGYLSVSKLKMNNSLVVMDTLIVSEELGGEGELINKGVIKLGMMNTNFKIDSLNLSYPNNELHLIRNGHQKIPKISKNRAEKIVLSGKTKYTLNTVNYIRTLDIKSKSSIELKKPLSLVSLYCNDTSHLSVSDDFTFDNTQNFYFGKKSTLEINNNQSFNHSIQVGNLSIPNSGKLTLNSDDTLKIGGNFTGEGVVNGNPVIEYNGSNRQKIKKIDYGTMIYNNYSNDSSTIYSNISIENLKIMKGKLKVGDLKLNKCTIDSLGKLIIGGHKPIFMDTTKIKGCLIIQSDDALPQFYFISIQKNGKFINNSSSDVVITKGIENDGALKGCKGTACDYLFLNDSVFILGKDTAFIPRVKANNLYNRGIVSINKKIDVDSLFNLGGGVLVLSTDTQNTLGFMDFSSDSNTVVFNKKGNQIFAKSLGVFQNLTIQNEGSKSISSNIIVHGNLVIQKYSHLKTDSFQIIGNPSGLLKIDSLAKLTIGDNFSRKPIEFPLFFSKINCHDSSAVIYASMADQNISSLPHYGCLTIDDGAIASCKKYISGDSLIVKGNLKLSESSLQLFIDDKTVYLKGDWNGPGDVILTTGKFYIGGDGNSSGRIQPGNSEFIYNGLKSQKIKISDYHTLTIDKIGKASTRANSGSLQVKNKVLVKNGNLNFNSEKSNIYNLIVEDSVTFSSKYQEKSFENISISSNGIFLLNYDEEIYVYGNIDCEGYFICSKGKILFLDSTKDQSINGTGNITLNQIDISKNFNSLEINSDVLLKDTLFMNDGRLILNAEVKIEESGYISGETLNNPITGVGKLSLNEDIPSGTHKNIKGLGVSLNSSTDLGKTLIEREFEALDLGNSESINRVYTIEPSYNYNLNVNLSFNYFESELNNNNENELIVFKSSDGGISWNNQSSFSSPINNCISLNNISSFSKWTAGTSNDRILAVELLYFEAKREDQNNDIIIKWEVLAELNTQAYQINYSFDGLNFDSLTTCYPNNSLFYSYNWLDAPIGTVYFELIEVETDNTRILLDTAVVSALLGENPKAWVVNNKIHTRYFPTGTLNVYDAGGRIIMKNEYEISHLPPGMYYIELLNEIGRWTFEFLK